MLYSLPCLTQIKNAVRSIEAKLLGSSDAYPQFAFDPIYSTQEGRSTHDPILNADGLPHIVEATTGPSHLGIPDQAHREADKAINSVCMFSVIQGVSGTDKTKRSVPSVLNRKYP